MADSYRGHAVVEAPVEDVWAVVSHPETHPEWWPDVIDVGVSGEVAEGGEYTRVARRLGFLDSVDSIWVAERLTDLKEAHFRCTVSGAFARFSLTPAQRDTFVEVETGMLPPNLRWRVAKALGRPLFRRWIRDVLDALPGVVARRPRRREARTPSPALPGGGD